MSLKRAMSKISIHSAKNFPMDFFKNHNRKVPLKPSNGTKEDCREENASLAERQFCNYSSRNKFIKPISKQEMDKVPTVNQRNIVFAKSKNGLRSMSSIKESAENTKNSEKERAGPTQKFQDTFNVMKDKSKKKSLKRKFNPSQLKVLSNRPSMRGGLEMQERGFVNNDHLASHAYPETQKQNFNYSNSKSNFGEKRLFKVNKLKSTSRESRSGHIQQNAKLMLGMKCTSTPTKVGQENRRHISELTHRHNNLSLKKEDSGMLPALKVTSRTAKKKRNHTESPARIQNFNSVINNKNDMLDSLKANLGRDTKQGMKKKIPLFNKTFKPKQRSNSENRKRQFAFSGLKRLSVINGETDLGKTKNFTQCNSDKKPQSGFQVNRENLLRTDAQYMCMIDDIKRNLDLGPESDLESLDSLVPHIPQRQHSDVLVSKLHEYSSTDNEVDSKYHCTFFPKENEQMMGMGSFKPIISPKIAINKKNFNFKEEIDKLSESVGSRGNPPVADSQYDLASSGRNNVDSSYNPFEVAKSDRGAKNKHLDFCAQKSKSDLGNTGGFLNKVEGSSCNVPNRHSEALKYNHNYMKINLKNDIQSLRSDEMMTSKCSVQSGTNKEGSTNLENSIVSSQMPNDKRFSDVRNSFKEFSAENTPTFTEELTNPFSTPSRNNEERKASFA